jgi:hypothetical protein
MKNQSSLKQNTLDQNLPTIPSKYQRIVKNDYYHNKSSPKLSKSYMHSISMAKLRNRSLQQARDSDGNMSTASINSSVNNKVLSNFNDTSTTGFSKGMYSEMDYKDTQNAAKMAIDKYHQSVNKRCAFGSSIKRFDSKQELKQAFNRDPGPGSYIEAQDLIKERLAKNDSTMSTRNRDVAASYSNHYSVDKSQFDSQTGSPGFGSKDQRFKLNPKEREQ